MDTDFAFICDYAEQDTKLHAVGIGFDTIFATALPAIHPVVTFVARLRGSVAERGLKSLSLRLIDAEGQDVSPPVEGQMQFDVKPGQLAAAANVVIAMQGIQFTKWGEHAFHLLVQDREMARVPFSVSEPPTTS